jgi:hypothetical protein
MNMFEVDEDGRVTIDAQLAYRLLQLAGVRSKRRRIQKKVIKRMLTEATEYAVARATEKDTRAS